MKILGIETSCDETAAAIVEDGTRILASSVASSKELHKKTGGIIPEVAAREQVKCIIPVINETLRLNSGQAMKQCNNITMNEIDAIAVTHGPGLNGSLLVGIETAKTIAFVTRKPIIPVNHVLAHIYANFVDNNGTPLDVYLEPEASSLALSRGTPTGQAMKQWNNETKFPSVALVVSGGHTELYLMESVNKLKWLGGTFDDAAGEAFDKTARMLGLGFGGGAAIAAEATKYKIQNTRYKIQLPRPLINEDTLNFSFSGLKTAVAREIKKMQTMEQWNNGTPKNASLASKITGSPARSASTGQAIEQLAYEIQEAITDVLVKKTLHAAQLHNAKSILLGGGVAANQRLKEKMELGIKNKELGITLSVPKASLCTDNAVMVAAYAYYHNAPVPWQKIQSQPDLSVEV